MVVFLFIDHRGRGDWGEVKGLMCVCVCWGGGGCGGWGQFLRTTLHTISIILNNSFRESYIWRLLSLKALRDLNDHWALPVYPVSANEKSNGSNKK